MALVTLTINGVDRTSLLKLDTLQINDGFGSRVTAEFEILDPSGAYRPDNGEPVVIARTGPVKIFAGLIDSPDDEQKPPGTKALKYLVKCADYSQVCDRHRVAGVYENMLAGDIIKDIVATALAGEGITTTNVQDGPVVTKILFNYCTATDAFNELAELAGFGWYVDFDKDLHFFDRATNAAPFNITDALNNARAVKVSRPKDRYRNRQFVRGSNALSDYRTETFAGDGSRREFFVTFPMQTVPTVKVNGIVKTVGIRGIDSGKDWYWSQGSDAISQDTSGAVLRAGDTLTVIYRFLYPVLLVKEDSTQISARQAVEGGTGVYEDLEEDSSVEDFTTAETLSLARLRQYGVIPTVVTYETDNDGLRSGQLQTIQIAKHNLNGSFLIESVSVKDISGKFLRYEVKAVSGERIGGWVDFFKSLIRGKEKLSRRENEVVTLLREQTDAITCADSLTPVSASPERRAGYAVAGFSEAG